MARRLRAALAAALAVASASSLSVAAAAAVPRSSGGSCRSTLPARMADLDGASELVTVVASDGSATTASITAWRRAGVCWHVALGPWIGRVGRSGIRADKREGDGATPLGLFDFYSTVYGNGPNPGVHLRYRPLRCGDWWDEDSSSRRYNTFDHVRCGAVPAFANGASEPLWESPVAYAAFAVIGYNSARTPGRGSAIFLHVSEGEPTAGCVALAEPLLDRVLDWLRLPLRPRIAIATRATIRSL